ncbi:MAG: hypothetical protein AAF928_10975 [Myxococcota bacterium]
MIIVGTGRVGGALAKRAEAAGADVSLVTREEGWRAIDERDDPIFVAVRNDDLDGVLARVAPAHHGRFVFTQNGMLRPWLSQHGLLHLASRGLLFFAVAARGAPLVPGSESLFAGPQAPAVVAWLRRLEIPARQVAPEAFAEVELEKLLWNCTMGLMCELTGTTVGDVVDRHTAQWRDLVDELLRVGMPCFGLDLDPPAQRALEARLASYSRSISDYRASVKEWPWRNGFFVEVATTPGLHHELLTRTGHLPR